MNCVVGDSSRLSHASPPPWRLALRGEGAGFSLPPTTASICVSFLTRNLVVASPIWTIENLLESHGPCASCELSIILDSTLVSTTL